MIVKRPFMALVVSLCLALFLPACEQEEQASKPVIRPVRTYQIFSSGGSRVRTFSGTAQAGVESRLSFRVSGKVRKVAVKVGDQVKAGQLIAELDPADYRLQVQEAEASLQQAKAENRNSDANYARVRALYENRNASRNDLDAARAAAESAMALKRSNENRLELARSQLRYTRLSASIDGAIAEVNIEANENVRAGQTVVLLTSGSSPEVKVAVPEILISLIREGEKVTVTFDAVPGKDFRAVVTEVGVATTGQSTTYPVTVRLDFNDPDVRPGMAAEVVFRFTSPDKRERFLVPPVAVGEDRQGRFVYIVETDQEGLTTTKRRPVKIGELTEEGLEVFEGLSDGDLVVVAGVSRIVDGQEVKLLTTRKDTP